METNAINQRYLEYLNRRAASPFARLPEACVLALGAVAFRILVEAVTARLWGQIALSFLLFGAAILAYSVALSARALHTQQEKTVRRVLSSGVPVMTVLVQANGLLYRRGPFALPCLVLFTFDPDYGQDADYMENLARRVYHLKDTHQVVPDLQYVVALVTDEEAERYRRRPLPVSFTGGPLVYAADLWVKRKYLRGGYLSGPWLPCIAEPGQEGGLELVPWWLAEQPAVKIAPSAAYSE